MGEEGDRQFPFEEPAGRLSEANVHDAGCEYSGGEPVERLARFESSGAVIEVEGQALEKRYGVRTAAGRAPALAHRCLLPQYLRHVLLSVQHFGRL